MEGERETDLRRRIIHVFTVENDINSIEQTDVTGKWGLICGASKGIGEQLVYEYAKAGANLVIVARSQELLEVPFFILPHTLPQFLWLPFVQRPVAYPYVQHTSRCIYPYGHS